MYFERPPADGDWSTIAEAREQRAEESRAPTDADRELWNRLVAAVSPLGTDPDVFDDGSMVELTLGEDGMQLTMFPDEISLSVPYWYDGEAATAITERLRRIVEVVESETGLVAFDPQVDAPFLDGGAAHAPAVFDHVATQLSAPPAPPGPPPSPETTRRRWPWRRS